jgi:hypothetical protein
MRDINKTIAYTSFWLWTSQILPHPVFHHSYNREIKANIYWGPAPWEALFCTAHSTASCHPWQA